MKKHNVTYEAHTICPHYDDGYHRKRSGWNACECGASSAWHVIEEATVPEVPGPILDYSATVKAVNEFESWIRTPLTLHPNQYRDMKAYHTSKIVRAVKEDMT